MEFFRQEYWNGLPFSSPGNLLDPGIEPESFTVSCIARRILYHWDTWEAWALRYQTVINMVETCVEEADENNSDVPSLWLPLVHTVEGACEKFPASDLDVQLFCEISLLHKVIFSLTFFHTMYLVHQNTCLILVTYTLSWRNMLGTLFLALF